MPGWEDDEFWSDEDETPPQVPVVGELEGSVYKVPDPLWGFQVPDREGHPGVCVRCDLPARLTFLYKGTDIRSARPDRFLYVTVPPSAENGLTKETAFALDPHRIRLHKLLNLHRGNAWLGRLEGPHFRTMRQHFEGLTRLFGRGTS